jgi:endonuclease/exonuclease/phosphatase family metal-dependent hydrolase
MLATTEDRHTSTETRPRSRRKERILVATAATVLVAFLLVQVAAQRGAVHCASGSGLTVDPPTVFAGEVLDVAVYNIHHGRGPDGETDLARTTECLSGCTLAGLCEMSGPYPWQARGQTEVLAEQLGLGCRFVPAEVRWGYPHLGNGLLSAIPIGDWEQIPLPHAQGRGFRSAFRFQFDWRESTIHGLLVHVDREGDRLAQLEVVTGLFARLPMPSLLLGDLNTTADDPALAKLLRLPRTKSAMEGLPLNVRSGAVDWILVRGLEVRNASVCDRGGSDHPCFRTELALSPDSPHIAASPVE